jgi:hypothetical protein
MSFIVAGCVLLLALLVGAALDIGAGGRRKARPETPPSDAW